MFAIEKVYSSNLNEGGCQLISQAANSTFTQRRKVCDFIQFQKTIYNTGGPKSRSAPNNIY